MPLEGFDYRSVDRIIQTRSPKSGTDEIIAASELKSQQILPRDN